MTSCEILIGTVYARLGRELEYSDLLNKEDWTPKKRSKDWTALDAEIVDLFNGVVRIIWGTPIDDLRAWNDKSNEYVKKLPEDERVANQLLLSVFLFEKWLMHDCSNFIIKATWKSRVSRIKWDILREVKKCGGEELASKTFIASDNYYRAIIGKPVLNTELREKHSKMIKERLKK